MIFEAKRDNSRKDEGLVFFQITDGRKQIDVAIKKYVYDSVCTVENGLEDYLLSVFMQNCKIKVL